MRSKTELHVGFAGEMDASTVAEFRGRLSHWLSVACNTNIPVLLADFEDVTFVDSNTVRTLIVIHQEASDSGVSFKVHRPQSFVHRVLEISNLLHLVDEGVK